MSPLISESKIEQLVHVYAKVDLKKGIYFPEQPHIRLALSSGGVLK